MRALLTIHAVNRLLILTFMANPLLIVTCCKNKMVKSNIRLKLTLFSIASLSPVIFERATTFQGSFWCLFCGLVLQNLILLLKTVFSSSKLVPKCSNGAVRWQHVLLLLRRLSLRSLVGHLPTRFLSVFHVNVSLAILAVLCDLMISKELTRVLQSSSISFTNILSGWSL